MTALCAGGGPSQARPGFGLTVDVSAAALGIRFANTASWFSVMVGAAIAGVAFVLQDYCTRDPPAVPVLTAQDFVDALQVVDWIAKFTAQQKIQQWVGAMMWNDLCMCVSGATPPAPTPPPAPPNMPTRDPPALLPPPNTATCASDFSTFLLTNGGGSTSILLNLAVPTGATTVRITASNIGSTNANSSVNFLTEFKDANNAVMQGYIDNRVVLNNDRTQYTLPVPVGAATLVSQASIFAGSNNQQNCRIDREIYCGAAAPTAQPACCPPDPVLMAEIQQILDLVTLIQRQNVPFAYVPGTVHAGLTGAGSFPIQGILGTKLAVTTMPGPIGVKGTSPAEYFDLGFLTFRTLDGYPQSVRIEKNPQLTLPFNCSAFTQLAYDLAPGAVVTITELRREP